MAKVILKSHWYGPNKHLYRKSATRKGPPVDIPDKLVKHLPTTATIVDADYVTPEVQVTSADTISAHRKEVQAMDPETVAMVTGAEAQARGDHDRKKAKAEFDAQLRAEEQAAMKAAKAEKKRTESREQGAKKRAAVVAGRKGTGKEGSYDA